MKKSIIIIKVSGGKVTEVLSDSRNQPVVYIADYDDKTRTYRSVIPDAFKPVKLEEQ